eukprot:COSAG02_NODE_39389_length_417_cov_1.905660_1_plen_92_part_00
MHILRKFIQSLEDTIVVPTGRELWKQVQLMTRILAHEGSVVREIVLPITRDALKLQATYRQCALRCGHVQCRVVVADLVDRQIGTVDSPRY